MIANTYKADTAHQELQALREEIKQFADSLEAFGSDGSPLPPSEVIATLNGIGQGALSCAALLKQVDAQANPKSAANRSYIETKRTEIQEDAGEILRHCAELSKLLRRLKRNTSSLPDAEMGEMEGTSQQVQAALSSITAEWEELA